MFGLGMRLRVRESKVSRNPVSLKVPASPSRQAIAVTGSMKENVTDQPELLRMKLAIGPLMASVEGGAAGRAAGGDATATCGKGAVTAAGASPSLSLRTTSPMTSS